MKHYLVSLVLLFSIYNYADAQTDSVTNEPVFFLDSVRVRSDILYTYDPNDLGYLESNNEVETGTYFSYDIYDPFWVILDMHNEISVEYLQLYDPREFTGLDISFENRTQFKNILTVGLEANISPLEQRDYFEPRNEGWYVKFPPSYSIGAFYSPDYNKTFVVDIMPGVSWASGYDQFGYYLRLSPRYKVNSHLFMVLVALYSRNFNDIGYITDSLSQDNELQIIFGKRDIENITTTLNVNYSINPKFSFSFRLRYYCAMRILEALKS